MRSSSDVRSSRLPRASTDVDAYVYRRRLTGRELLPAIGAGVAVGLAAFYIARVLLQRTPLRPLSPVERADRS